MRVRHDLFWEILQKVGEKRNRMGLYKRDRFLSVMDNYLEKHKDVTVIIADLNNFKLINHMFGLAGGDLLIRQIADFMHALAQRKHSFRIAGDQFAIIATEDADEIVQKMQERFSSKFKICDTYVKIPVSVCKIPASHADSKEMLMLMIENAVALAKKTGKGSYVELSQKSIQQMKRKVLIEKALRYAVEEKTICVYYQPIFSIKEDCMMAAEALLRMEDPDLGFVSPDEFIQVAESCGMINTLGEIAIHKSCQFIAENNLQELGLKKIDINISAVQFMQENFIEKVQLILHAYDIDLKYINFEITESAAIYSEEALLSMMRSLKKSGIQFSMDDYGKGYSNFGSILKFPFHLIKLDKEMLWDSFKDERAMILYENTVHMIKKLGMEIIAEGAETKEQVDALARMGVDYVQGFYYSKPLPEHEFLQLLKMNREE